MSSYFAQQLREAIALVGSRRARSAGPPRIGGRPERHRRALALEPLEARHLLTALPFGAMPDDTGEYLLGDVRVTVVLLESTGAIDDGAINYTGESTINYTPENWSASAINAVKANVEEGLAWWETALETLGHAGQDLLNFSIDWTYADTPVQTGYEPIARKSNDFSLWMYDFLNVTGFNQTGNFSADIRAFNNFQRQQTNADWAFTIFVVNNETDPDKFFHNTGSFSQAFSFAGGRFMVVPASRPASTFAHEAGHMFWALDEYSGAGNYLTERGYYSTQNSNAANNPEPGFVQEASIMASGTLLQAAYASYTSSTPSLEMIGWKDTDGDGIFDVLDVPFTLTGSGYYDAENEVYHFTGNSNVQTLPNLNPSGLQNDITINRIREVQVSIDGGAWNVVQALPDRTYQTSLDLEIPLAPGEHTIRIRTVDTRTTVMSPEFIGTTTQPSQTEQPGASGYVFYDTNNSGTWDPGEAPLVDWAVEIVDEFGAPVELSRMVEPNHYAHGQSVTSVHPEAIITAIGGDAASSTVTARNSSRFPAAGKVFFGQSLLAGGNPAETWTSSTRRMRVDFTSPVTTVSLRALSNGSPSVGRLEAFDADGNLVARYTTKTLASGQQEIMTVSTPGAQIAYVVARAHLGTEVLLDTLTWGPGASATTNALGAWALPHLESGTYILTVNAPPSLHVTTPAAGTYTISVAAGEVSGNLNFGIGGQGNIWHNLAQPANVNNDSEGAVNVLDLLAVVNWLVRNQGNSTLPPTGNPQSSGHVDVNNDGSCNILDLLAVVNHITQQMSSGGGGEGELAGGGLGGEGGSGAGEGESLWALASSTPQNAAEYYAEEPFHLLEIPGTDLPCCCGGCLAVSDVESASTAVAGGAPLWFPADLMNSSEHKSTLVRPTARRDGPVATEAHSDRLRSELLGSQHRWQSPAAAGEPNDPDVVQSAGPEAADVSTADELPRHLRRRVR
jgi:hypothetical protein